MLLLEVVYEFGFETEGVLNQILVFLNILTTLIADCKPRVPIETLWAEATKLCS